jgi:hypothetical protein
MKIDKNYKMSRLFVMTALIVAVSGLTVLSTTIAPLASGLTNPGLSAEAIGCLIYQTYPAQVDCTVPTSPNSF